MSVSVCLGVCISVPCFVWRVCLLNMNRNHNWTKKRNACFSVSFTLQISCGLLEKSVSDSSFSVYTNCDNVVVCVSWVWLCGVLC